MPDLCLAVVSTLHPAPSCPATSCPAATHSQASLLGGSGVGSSATLARLLSSSPGGSSAASSLRLGDAGPPGSGLGPAGKHVKGSEVAHMAMMARPLLCSPALLAQVTCSPAIPLSTPATFCLGLVPTSSSVFPPRRPCPAATDLPLYSHILRPAFLLHVHIMGNEGVLRSLIEGVLSSARLGNQLPQVLWARKA